MKKKYFLFIIGLFFICMSILVFYWYKQEIALDSIASEKKIYIEETNSWLDKKKKDKEIYKNSPKEKSNRDEHWDRLKEITQAHLKEIEFYGKIIDQYENPVSQATVKYNAQSGYLAKGSGHQRTISDNQGVFVIKGDIGVGLAIYEIKKLGYQFDVEENKNFDNSQRFPDSKLWSNYSTPEDPYIFKGWKVEKYPKVKVSEESGYLLSPDGRTSTFYLHGEDKVLKRGEHNGDFTITVNKTDERWVIRLTGLNGGLIETNDLYTNLAPEVGYQSVIVYNFPVGSRNVNTKNYYIKLRNGYYASMKIEYRAYDYKNGKIAIFLSYVVNMEKGRSLSVKK